MQETSQAAARDLDIEGYKTSEILAPAPTTVAPTTVSQPETGIVDQVTEPIEAIVQSPQPVDDSQPTTVNAEPVTADETAEETIE